MNETNMMEDLVSEPSYSRLCHIDRLILHLLYFPFGSNKVEVIKLIQSERPWIRELVFPKKMMRWYLISQLCILAEPY